MQTIKKATPDALKCAGVAFVVEIDGRELLGFAMQRVLVFELTIFVQFDARGGVAPVLDRHISRNPRLTALAAFGAFQNDLHAVFLLGHGRVLSRFTAAAGSAAAP
jgi:hypothetical protein